MFALCNPTWRVCSNGNTPKFRPKVTHPLLIWASETFDRKIPAEWLQIAQRSRWRAYRKLPSLFLMVPSLTPYDFPFPQNGGSICPPTYANGHISATGDPIHFMFGSMVGYSGTADRTALFTVRTNPRWRPRPCWIKFQVAISATGCPIHFMFYSRVGFSGTADLMAQFPVRTNPRWRPSPSWKNFKWPYLRNGSRSSYIARIARSSLR